MIYSGENEAQTNLVWHHIHPKGFRETAYATLVQGRWYSKSGLLQSSNDVTDHSHFGNQHPLITFMNEIVGESQQETIITYPT